MGPLCLGVCAFQCLSHKTKFQSQTFKILVSFSAYYQASQELVDECRGFFKNCLFLVLHPGIFHCLLDNLFLWVSLVAQTV